MSNMRLTWIDRLITTRRLFWYVPICLALSTAFYLLTVATAAIFAPKHVNELAFVIGGLGVALTMVAFKFIESDYNDRVKRVRETIDPTSLAAFDRIEFEHRQYMGNILVPLLPSLLAWIVFLWIEYTSVSGTNSVPLVSELRFFSSSWYASENVSGKMITLGVFTFPCFFSLATVCHALVSHSIFTLRIAQLKYVPALSAVSHTFNAILSIGVRSSLMLTAGLSLFWILLQNTKLGWLQLIFYSPIILVSVFGFVVPLLIIRHQLNVMRNRLLDELRAVVIDIYQSDRDPEDKHRALTLLEMKMDHTASMVFIGGYANLMAFVSSYVLPVVVAETALF